MDWTQTLSIVLIMILQTVICAAFFLLGLSTDAVKNHLAQRVWIRNFKAVGRMPEGANESPEDEGVKDQEKQENESLTFYS